MSLHPSVSVFFSDVICLWSSAKRGALWTMYIKPLTQHLAWLSPNILLQNLFPSTALAFCYFRRDYSKFFEKFPLASSPAHQHWFLAVRNTINNKHSGNAEAFQTSLYRAPFSYIAGAKQAPEWTSYYQKLRQTSVQLWTCGSSSKDCPNTSLHLAFNSHHCSYLVIQIWGRESGVLVFKWLVLNSLFGRREILGYVI